MNELWGSVWIFTKDCSSNAGGMGESDGAFHGRRGSSVGETRTKGKSRWNVKNVKGSGEGVPVRLYRPIEVIPMLTHNPAGVTWVSP